MTKSVSSTRSMPAPLRAHRVHLFLNLCQRQRREFSRRQLARGLQQLPCCTPTKCPRIIASTALAARSPCLLASSANSSGNSMVIVVIRPSTAAMRYWARDWHDEDYPRGSIKGRRTGAFQQASIPASGRTTDPG